MPIGFGEPIAYSLVLQSSNEIHDGAVKIYGEEIGASEREEDNDPLLGAPNSDRPCETCKQTLHGCPGHFAAVKVPPIAQPIVAPDLNKLLSILCPLCSRVVIPQIERNKYARSLNKPSLSDLRGWVISRGEPYFCPFCKERFVPLHPLPIYAQGRFVTNIITVFTLVPLKTEKTARTRKPNLTLVKLIDNRDVWNILTKVTAEDCLLCGFNPQVYHPHKFMTEYVPIAPPSARPRPSGVGPRFVNKTRRLHDRIRELASTILAKLAKTKMSEFVKEDAMELIKDMESLCISVTFLQTQTSKDEASLLQSKLFSQPQDFVSYLAMLSKKDGVFRKLALGSRHDVSARAVLIGFPFGSIGTVSFPKLFAMKVHIPVVVNTHNIGFLRSLVRNGKSRYPGAISFWRNNVHYAIDDQKAEAIATSLIPGDRVGRHVLPGDFVLHNRYPSLREESIDLLMVTISNDTTISIPLAGCAKKNADFDGDESQVFFPTSIGVAAESFVLQSNIRQFIAPSNGLPAIFGTNDTIIGIRAFMNSDKWTRKQAHYLLENGYNTQGIELKQELYTGNDIVSFALPSDFNYVSDAITVRNGKIVAGKFTSDAVSKGSAYLLKAIANNIGSYAAILFLENVTRFAYAANRIVAQSHGDDLRLSPKAKKEIERLKEDRLKQMRDFSLMFHNGLVKAPHGKDPEEYYDFVQQTILGEKNAKEILAVIRADLKGSTYDATGALSAHATELTGALGAIGQISLQSDKSDQNTRPPAILAHGSRAMLFFPRYLDTPEARGHVAGNYASGKKASEHVFESEADRRKIHQRGAETAQQGYFERKSAKSLLPIHMGYFGEVRGDGHSVVSFNYGHINGDARSVVNTRLDEWFVSNAEFKKRFDTGIVEEFEQLVDIKQRFINDIIAYASATSDTRYSATTYVYNSPVDIDFLLMKFKPEKKSKADPKQLWSILTTLDQRLRQAFMVGKLGAHGERIIANRIDAFKRIYKIKLCTKVLLDLGFGKDDCEKICEAFVYKFKFSIVPPGDNVGLKAALSITEPLTQGILNAIHAKGGSVDVSTVIRRHGIDRIEELTESSNQKNPVTTIVLKEDLRYDYLANLEFAKKIDTVKLSSMIYPSQLISSAELYGSASDKEFLEAWMKDLPPSLRSKIRGTSVSPFKLRLNIKTTSIRSHRVSLMDIQLAIQKAYDSTVAYVAIENTMDMITRAYVYFMPGLRLDTIRAICYDLTTELIIHGSGDFTNASVIKYTNDYVQAKDGSLEAKTSYRVEANGKGLLHILSLPDVDHKKTFSNDMEEMIRLYGIEEARGRLFEEFFLEASASSDLKELLRRHFRIYIDYITYRGKLSFITRHSLKDNPEADVLAKMAFEDTHKFAQQAIREGRVMPLEGHIPRVVHGVQPNNGSGLSQVRIKTGAIGVASKGEVLAKFDELIQGPKEKKKKEKVVKMSQAHIPTFLEAFEGK